MIRAGIVGLMKTVRSHNNACTPVYQQRRQNASRPMVSRPKYPMSAGEKVLLGGGWILVILLIPIWGLFSVPVWAERNRQRQHPDPEPEEVAGGADAVNVKEVGNEDVKEVADASSEKH